MSKKIYHVYALLAVMLWAVAYVFTRKLSPYFSALSIAFLRFSTASVTVTVIMLVKKMKMPDKKAWPWLILAGISGFFFGIWTFNIASRTVPAAAAGAISSINPVLTALMARIFYKEKLPAIRYVSIGICAAGIVLLVALRGGVDANIGSFIMLLSSALWAVNYVVTRKITHMMPAFQVSAFSILIGTVPMLFFAPKAVDELAEAPPISYLYIIIMGVFSAALAYYMFAKALEMAEKTSTVTNYPFLSPFFSAFFGFVFLGEVLDMPTIVGGTVVIIGLAIFNFHEKLGKIFCRGNKQIRGGAE